MHSGSRVDRAVVVAFVVGVGFGVVGVASRAGFVFTEVSSIKTTRSGCADTAGMRYLNQSSRRRLNAKGVQLAELEIFEDLQAASRNLPMASRHSAISSGPR